MSNCCKQYPECGCGSKKPFVKLPYVPPTNNEGGPAIFCDIEEACQYVLLHAGECGCQHVCKKDNAEELIKSGLRACAIACEGCHEQGGWFYSPFAYLILQLSLMTNRKVKTSLGYESYTYESTDSLIARLKKLEDTMLEKLGCLPCKSVPQMQTLTTSRINILAPTCKSKCKGKCRCR